MPTKCAVEGCDTTEKNKDKKGLWLHKFPPKGQLISKRLFGRIEQCYLGIEDTQKTLRN